MIPYFQAGQAFLVQKGNPANIQTTTDLCGKKVAVEAGTTMLDYLSGTGDFKNGGLPKVCSDASLPAVQADALPEGLGRRRGPSGRSSGRVLRGPARRDRLRRRAARRVRGRAGAPDRARARGHQRRPSRLTPPWPTGRSMTRSRRRCWR